MATNIAETSVTIPEIGYGKNNTVDKLSYLIDFFICFYTVIDCGFVKMKAFSPKTALGMYMSVCSHR